jgi:hypothetical protein
MTNSDAIKRLQEKIRYVTEKLADGSPTDKARYWLERDQEAFTLAVAALEYTEAMREYEASQSQVPTA